MAKCSVCNCNLGIMNKTKALDGVICFHCSSICDSYKTETVSNLKKYWEINNERQNKFVETSKLKNMFSSVITIDNNNKLFFVGDSNKNKVTPIIYSFNEVSNYEYETVGAKTVTKKKGGISRAVVGGLVAGPVGAVVGSTTSKSETTTVGGTSLLKIYMSLPSGKHIITLANAPSGFTDFLDKCILQNKEQSSSTQLNSIDEIKKYKELLDIGVITNEEFEIKKKELLNL